MFPEKIKKQSMSFPVVMFLVSLFNIFIPVSIVCQQQLTQPSEEKTTIEPNRVALAISAQDYPVTPGDTYRLTFYSGGDLMTNNIIVESDYNINLGIFRKINAAGKTFPEIKKLIESRIADAYPESMPSLSIISVGLFLVQVKGELNETQYVSVWGLSRLNEVISKKLSAYSSMRQVGIISKKGILTTYDLYKSIYEGELSQNPYLSPGDTIVIYSRGKQIEIAGGVERPGNYQILNTEYLQDAIDRYSKGFKKNALKTRISILRIGNNGTETFYVNMDTGNAAAKTDLSDGDRIFVPTLESNMPVVYIEGAIVLSQQEGQPAVLTQETGYNRITYNYSEGETVFDAVNKNRLSFSSLADFKNAYIIDSISHSRIPVNLEDLLFGYHPEPDRKLNRFDTIVIPFKKTVISVQGDVRAPGNYGYNANKDFRYYIDIAGGLISGSFDENIIKIRKDDGSFKDVSSPLLPGDTIEVRTATVSVIGAVIRPATYPFVKGKKFFHYTALAGGVDTERNTDNVVIIKDVNGNVCDPKLDIRPNDIIFVPNNSFGYNFNQVAPIITTTLSLATTVITLILLINNIQHQ